MDRIIRAAQQKILKLFSKEKSGFALTGGTALELFYLHHRFSADLDFFSPKYDIAEIERLISALQGNHGSKIKLETEFAVGGRARVRFYTLSIKGTKRVLKMDFVEDVLFARPNIRKIQGINVYSAENIYLQKLAAICGTQSMLDDTGREVMQGRNKARDAYDLYMLSKKIKPLHLFLKRQSKQMQRGMVHWYRTFSRQGLKLATLDLDIYDKNFNAKDMITHLENEIKRFINQMLEK